MYRLSQSHTLPAEQIGPSAEDILDAINHTNPGIIGSLVEHGFDYYDALKLLKAVVQTTLKYDR